jgi:hypothetical protein
MSQPGYHEGNERVLWWKVAMHLDEAQRALANAMSHNVDDPRPVHALHDRLREGQAILLEIFRAKGLLPGPSNGKIEVPMPGMPGMSMPMPMPTASPPTSAVGEAAAPVPASEVQQVSSLAAEDPAISEADHAAVETAAESVGETPPVPIVSEASEAASAPSSADPGTGGAAG